MSDAALSPISRRRLLALIPSSVLVSAAAPAPRIITILGDSITAGYGLPRAAALPARLEAVLRRQGLKVVVRGAGVSGDTTAGGLARVKFSVQNDTNLVVVALGANDLLRGLDPRRTAANLDGIVKNLLSRRMRVLLVGVRAPASAGPAFAREFNAVFGRVARSNGVELYPNLLSGVAGLAHLNQPDGIHPNARGVDVIASRLAPVLAIALKQGRSSA